MILGKIMKNERTEKYHIKKAKGNDIRKRDPVF